MTWKRVLFVVLVVAALAWAFGLGPWVRTERDGMNGGQQTDTLADPGVH